jgi:hypothetical protein
MSNNKQQTAVEWLEETMLKPLIQWPDDIWEQAKEMEKEQIINAVDGFPLANRNLDGSEYYEKTYGGDK